MNIYLRDFELTKEGILAPKPILNVNSTHIPSRVRFLPQGVMPGVAHFLNIGSPQEIHPLTPDRGSLREITNLSFTEWLEFILENYLIIEETGAASIPPSIYSLRYFRDTVRGFLENGGRIITTPEEGNTTNFRVPGTRHALGITGKNVWSVLNATEETFPDVKFTSN